MTAFLFRAGAGTPGDCTRPSQSTIETGFLYAPLLDTPVPTKFGAIVFAYENLSGQTEFAIAQSPASTPGADFYGILVRMAPSSAGSLDQSFGSGVPNINNPQGIGRKGYFNVTVNPSTFSILRGEPVNIRLVTGGPGENIGDLTPAFIVGETEELPGVVWGIDGYDSNNVTEIYIK
jgi:hypothetical protein